MDKKDLDEYPNYNSSKNLLKMPRSLYDSISIKTSKNITETQLQQQDDKF